MNLCCHQETSVKETVNQHQEIMEEDLDRDDLDNYHDDPVNINQLAQKNDIK